MICELPYALHSSKHSPFVDEHQPGFVECAFTDAQGRPHKIVDKLPIFTSQNLWTDLEYPQPSVIRCEILDQKQDSSGRRVARVTIAKPDDLESLDGLCEFVLLRSEIFDD